MSDFIEIMTAEELSDGEMKMVEIDDHPVLVARADGAHYVADAYCPHLHGHLWMGTLEGTVVTCPRHGSQFDLTDGRVIRWTKFTGPVQTMAELTRHPRPLRVYETLVTDGKLFVGPQKPPPASAD